jgi:hypothetical protein
MRGHEIEVFGAQGLGIWEFRSLGVWEFRSSGVLVRKCAWKFIAGSYTKGGHISI